MSAILTVSQINRYLASKIRSDTKLKSIAIKGEISNLNMGYASGHYYFTLKDENSCIKAVMFAGATRNLKIELINGLNVMVLGNVDCYERDGVYQIIVTDIQPIGIGALKETVDNLKIRLKDKGYFDTKIKKQIPYAPKTIGVITSAAGAALQDILNILKRRYPICKVFIFPTLVQGTEAGDNIVRALAAADSMSLDTLILARGGGSAEDLSAFNEEKVADAIFKTNTPVISAVGHETDFTIADLTADLRAPTPSAAAELVSPDIKNYFSLIESLKLKLAETIKNRISNSEMILKSSYERFVLTSPEKRIELGDVRLRNAQQRLKISIENELKRNDSILKASVSLLDSYSPLKVLSRGYSLTMKNEKVITKSDDVSVGDIINIKFSNSSVDAEIKNIN